MNIKITNKDGITLKTKGKYCTEDINVVVDESLLGGEGAVIKTSGSTTVPNTGYVEKVYLNTSMSVDEVVEVLSQLTLNMEGTNEILLGCMSPVVGITIASMDGMYIIGDFANMNFYFSSAIVEELGITFTGWNPDFNGEIEINGEVMSEEPDSSGNIPIGTQNELIKDLFSLTPFGSGEEIKLEGEYQGVDLVYDGAITQGVAVPNTGYVDKVYFNTSMSVDEVVEVLSQIDVHYSEILLFPSDMNIDKLIGVTGGTGYNGVYLLSVGTKVVFCSKVDSGVNDATFVGWAEGFNGVVEINGEVVNDFSGSTAGTQNELIKDLFSTTPFTKSNVIDIKSMIENNKEIPLSIEVNVESSGGAKVVVPPILPVEVPADGSLVDIYVNTSLSIAEVDAILDTIEIIGSSSSYIVYPFWAGSYIGYLQIEKGYTGWVIKDFITGELIYDSTGGSSGIVGWDPNFNGVIKYTQFVEENGYGYADPLVDNQNAKLINLFSITPFGEDGEEVVLSGEYDGTTLEIEPEIYEGTPVPSSGYIDTIYFNTSLSNDEVISILDEFFNNHPDLKGYGYYNVACIEININSDGAYYMYGWAYIYQSIYGLSGPKFEGWNPECTDIILCKENVETNDTTGMYNSELSRLFSITPFKSDTIDLKKYIDNKKLPLKIKLK